MSTRVQKGNTVFRPIAKPRPRAGGEPRQVSVTPEGPSSSPSFGGPNRTVRDDTVPPSRGASAMPPPSIIPSKQPPALASTSTPILSQGNGTSNEYTTALDNSSFELTSIPESSRDVSRPPAIQSTSSRPPMVVPLREVIPNTATAINAPSRRTPVPILLSKPMPGSSSAPQPIITPARPPVTAISVAPPRHAVSSFESVASHSPSSLPALPIDPALLDQAPASQSIQQEASTSTDRPRLSLGPESAVKARNPRRKASKKDVAVDEGASEPGQDGPSQRKPKGRRTKKAVSGPEQDVQPGSDQGVDAENYSVPARVVRKRRSRTASATDPAHSDAEASSSTQKKRKRTSSGSVTSRRSRTREPSPAFDPDAGPGEELDPTVTTMAALCNDTGQGRISSKAALIVSNHSAWRAANREKRARMRAAMEARKYGRDPDAEDGQGGQNASQSGPQQQEGSSAPPGAMTAEASGPQSLSTGDALLGGADGQNENADGDMFDYSQALSTSQYNVQVRIGPNGETIIDEESLFVNRNEEQSTEDYTHVEESDISKFVNSSSYSKKMRGSRWSAEETELFFDALSQFGENYELISYVLPGRDRKACKNKFKSEDKKNPSRITYCLNNRTPYDIQTLARLTGKDFSGPTPLIRAPEPLRSSELDTHQAVEEKREIVRKKSRTPAPIEDGVEILGNVDDMDDD